MVLESCNSLDLRVGKQRKNPTKFVDPGLVITNIVFYLATRLYFEVFSPKTDWINAPAHAIHVPKRRASKGANETTPLDAGAYSAGYPYSRGLPTTRFLERYDNYPTCACFVVHLAVTMALDVLRAFSTSIAVCSVGILIYLPEDLPRHRRSSFDCPTLEGLPYQVEDEPPRAEVEDLRQEGVQADDDELLPERGIEAEDAQEHACVGESSKTPEGHQDRQQSRYRCNAQRRSRTWH